MGTPGPDHTSSATAEKTSTRQRILAAALQIIEEQGFSALTQPRVAKLAGVRQSNLTYYFPKKSDLLLGVLEASHHKADGHSESTFTPIRNFEQIIPFLQGLMFDPKRARFFFSTLLEVSDDSELRPAIAAHARGLASFIAPYLNRSADDLQVQLFVDLLRGIAFRKLMEPETPVPDLNELIKIIGL